MIRKSVVFWLGLAAVAGGVLFHTSYEVQGLEERLAGLNRRIIEEQEHIQILNADWGYMNDPSRLERLAEQHLKLRPTVVVQLARLDTIPLRPQAPVAPDLPPVAYVQVPAMAGPSTETVAAPTLVAAAARPVAVPPRGSAVRPDRPRRPAPPLPIRGNGGRGDEIGLLLARIGVN